MDKNAIKKYAIWARRELIERVSQRAMIYGINAQEAGDPNVDSVNGHLLSAVEKRQRQALIHKINEKGYEQVMEEVAYTWFNRFAALRFMEVNGYLPSHIRVFTNDAGEFKPQILAEAIHLELVGLDMSKVYMLESANKSEELFKYLLIVQCNSLNSILPGMFQRIEDYTELLLPDYLLREGSVIEQMVTTIPEEDWTDQVQIIGWLYQYYNTEPKDEVFANLKKNIKITKENIPAATQLFTPDWIVHYMVENSLGRIWLEGHPNNALKAEWKYYLDEAEQEPEVHEQLVAIQKEYATLKPEDIRVIDPCMGSGHILCVLFDVLIRIYEDYGYIAREAAVKIVGNNLWGLDIDERAAQLSYFAVMMKARQYDRRFFSRNVQPHVYVVDESNGITPGMMRTMGQNLSEEDCGKALKQALLLVEELHDAKEYGSIIHVTPCDWDLLRRFAAPREETEQLHISIHGEIELSERLQKLIDVGETLSQKYEVVVTNPPYMGGSGMSAKLSDYVKDKYPKSKSDMSTVFMEKALSLNASHGLVAMINIPVWMFITSYEQLRKTIIRQNSIVNMVHPGRGIFGSDFGTTAFVIAKKHRMGYLAQYRRLFNTQVEVETVEAREKAFFSNKGVYFSSQEKYESIPGCPIAYWVSGSFIEAFEKGKLLGDCIPVKKGMDTGDNNKYLRLWFEVSYLSIDFYSASKKWVPYDKGGDFRKWYGNNSYIVNWENDGFALKHSKANLRSQHLYFKESITWNALSAGNTCFRYSRYRGTFDSAGSSMFPETSDIPYYLGLMNSKISQHYLNVINPTINYGAGSMAMVPVLPSYNHLNRINELAKDCIELSIADWNSFETSWDYQEHPFVTVVQEAAQRGKTITIEEAFEEWERIAATRFQQVKTNEEELNRIFIGIYNLKDELAPDVSEKDVTIRRANLKRDIRGFISYAVGCMFGRYTLGKKGLMYAGGTWKASEFPEYPPDQDAIIPISDDEYFDDDIVGRFVLFVEKTFGVENLEENLRYIAESLDYTGTPREIIRSYFLNDFYLDHCSTYSVAGSGKRPIYWLFDSGKANGFKCLVYMHRYQPDTIAKIRTDYVHEQQSRYRTAISDLEQRINHAAGTERVKLSKQLTKLQAQEEEVRVYEEKIHHLADQMIEIDLDDGVKHNYALFKDVLAKIK